MRKNQKVIRQGTTRRVNKRRIRGVTKGSIQFHTGLSMIHWPEASKCFLLLELLYLVFYYIQLVNIDTTFLPEEEKKDRLFLLLVNLILADFVALWRPVSLFGPGG